ncbi:MAG: hypothetical protein KF781_04445 [Chitinophagaceae bacterium]|nr:hypothetical protein [Chitinophagaceae bacterium]MCW5904667.1 hypothetical protein [Chitinophagaceae bacterium]
MRKMLLIICCISLFVCISIISKAQTDTSDFVYDTFFLAKKKGIFGKIGKSISADPPKPEVTRTGTIKNDLPFNKYKGYTIRHIYVKQLDFTQNINDSSISKRNLGIRIADALHKQTREKYIRYNLFFDEGDKLIPYLLADNERYLRDIDYIQDARLQIVPIDNNTVDVMVISKDVFSLGGNVDAGGLDNFNIELKDENLFGHAQKFSLKMLYDDSRNPTIGYGAEYLKRNMGGSFLDWTTGFRTFNNAFNSWRKEETVFYTRVDRPLVSPYLPFTGSAELSYRQTANAYLTDSLYKSDYKYRYVEFDVWAGYNLGAKRYLKTNTQSRIRKFISLRAFHKKFQEVPGLYKNNYSFIYQNITGVLGAVTIFKQNFYKTNFIYGFGRNEDVPEGFSFSAIAGWTNRQGVSSPYYGIDFNRNYFNRKGNYYNYTFRLGGYLYNGQFYDTDVLLNLEYFSHLKHIGGLWYTRYFLNAGITHQIRPSLNQPLFLSSPFGLQEIDNGTVAAQTRFTLKNELTIYNKWKLLGFRFAGFVFGNGSLLTPRKAKFTKSDFYSSFGTGLRTRNESLIFGTLELRASYFPRINFGMNHFKIDINTDIRFKYNSTFIKRPDFVSAN